MSQRPTTLLESFTYLAREMGWDTHKGSSGRCWLVARAFAEHATTLGHRLEIWGVTNPRSTRPQDDQQHLAVVDGWAVDFASRAGAGGDAMHWPTVAPLDDFLVDYGERLSLCPTCGSTGDFGAQLVRKPLTEHDCPGLLPLEEHEARLARQVNAALEAW